MLKTLLILAKLKGSLLLVALTMKNLLRGKLVNLTLAQLRKKLKEQGWLVWAFDGENQSRTYYAKHLKTGKEFDGTLAEFKLLAKNIL